MSRHEEDSWRRPPWCGRCRSRGGRAWRAGCRHTWRSTTQGARQCEGTLVAHVDDVHGDTVTLMVGEREVVVHDRDLVARLARAAF